MPDYELTVAAALSETKSKFALAEALVRDIPPQRGRDAETNRKLSEARQAIIDAGGEARTVKTLLDYRRTAQWVILPTSVEFRWLPRVSFSAHQEARAYGLTYDDFAALPRAEQTVDAIRRRAGVPGTDGQPVKIVRDWTPEQQAEVVRLVIKEDPRVAIAAEHAVNERRKALPGREPEPAAPSPRPQQVDYDRMVEQGIDKIMLAFAADAGGDWTPSERTIALLYFLRRALMNLPEPKGQDLTDEFADIERFANEATS